MLCCVGDSLDKEHGLLVRYIFNQYINISTGTSPTYVHTYTRHTYIHVRVHLRMSTRFKQINTYEDPETKRRLATTDLENFMM